MSIVVKLIDGSTFEVGADNSDVELGWHASANAFAWHALIDPESAEQLARALKSAASQGKLNAEALA